MLDIENAYAQSPMCASCALCLLDGPVPDFEAAVVTGISDEEE